MGWKDKIEYEKKWQEQMVQDARCLPMKTCVELMIAYTHVRTCT